MQGHLPTVALYGKDTVPMRDDCQRGLHRGDCGTIDSVVAQDVWKYNFRGSLTLRKKSGTGIILRFPRREPLASAVFDSYWQFAAERQAIFFRRISGEAAPWTEDEILSTFRFTNAYRASDRVSQYLIRHVIYDGDHSAQDLVFRIILFKLFNKIETWQL